MDAANRSELVRGMSAALVFDCNGELRGVCVTGIARAKTAHHRGGSACLTQRLAVIHGGFDVKVIVV